MYVVCLLLVRVVAYCSVSFCDYCVLMSVECVVRLTVVIIIIRAYGLIGRLGALNSHYYLHTLVLPLINKSPKGDCNEGRWNCVLTQNRGHSIYSWAALQAIIKSSLR